MLNKKFQMTFIMGLNSSGGQIVRKIGGSRYFGWFVGGVPETRHTL